MNVTLNTKQIEVKTASILQELKSQPGLPFSNILSEEEINSYLFEGGQRDRVFTPTVTLNCLLSQAINEDGSCQNAVVKLIADRDLKGLPVPSANTSAYCQARSRLANEGIEKLARSGSVKVENTIPEQWLWHNRHVKLIDGSTISMPDSPENQKQYEQPSSQKKGLASQ